MTLQELQSICNQIGVVSIAVFFLEGTFQVVVRTKEESEFEHTDRNLESAVRGALAKATPNNLDAKIRPPGPIERRMHEMALEHGKKK